jgi:hypothetical protein
MVMSRRFTTSAIPQDLQDPYYLEMHRKAIMSSMYGLNNIMKVDIRDNRVKFILNTTGAVYDDMQEAFEAAGRSGITTFARLTGKMETSSENLRGLGGLSERLLDMQRTLTADSGLRNRLNISDPSKLFFEVGSFKMARGQKESTRNVLNQINSGIIIPDDGAFNVLRVFQGTAGQNPVELSIDQISRLFISTSREVGGVMASDELQKKLAENDLGSLFEKIGKRVKAIIALKDVSLAGEELSDIIGSLGTGQSRLNEKTVRVFKPAEDLRRVAEAYLSDPDIMLKKSLGTFGTLEENFLLDKSFDRLGKELSDELKAFYGGTGAIEAVIERLENSKISSMSDFQNAVKADMFKTATETGFDGSSVMNSKFSYALKKQTQKELDLLSDQMQRGLIGEEAMPRIKELTSQLQNMKSGNFEAITGRVFMTYENLPRMIKTVFDSAGFRAPLQKYAMLTTDVVLKKETALMAQVDSVQLVLQGSPSSLVYQDPLMPAFHPTVYDESFEAAQKARTERILGEYRSAIEEGKISQRLKASIFKNAEMDISGLPESVRNQQSRNKMFAQRLKQAIESGVDIRTMPQFLNYIKKHTESQLVRLKDGIYQPALEDAFRVAIDSEQSYYGGRAIANRARLRSATQDIQLADGKIIKAANFQIQGHKMLLGGDASSMFKQSLGTFDHDDHGIVMPRIFKDASGKDRLGTFIFRQPTGPAEFIFGKADFGNSDTIRSFLADNDAFGNALDDLMANSSANNLNKDAYMLLKRAMDPESKIAIDHDLAEFNYTNRGTAKRAGALELAIMDVMEKAESFGYKRQTIDAVKLFAHAENNSLGAGVSLSKERFEELLQSGVFGGDKVQEKYLVSQYNQGIIRRAFAESSSFVFDSNLMASIKSAVGESIYNSQLAGLQGNQEAYSKKVSELMNTNANLSEEIQVAITSELSARSRSAVENADSIGTYMNRLTVASAGSDQIDDIVQALSDKGVDKATVDSIMNRYIMAIGPSDAVDLVVNLSNSKARNIELTSSVIRAMYEGSTDPEQAAQAVARIKGIVDIGSETLLETMGSEMIQSKGRLIGQLRALAMMNLNETDRLELMAGMDKEFLRQRLSGQDASGFISGLRERI